MWGLFLDPTGNANDIFRGRCFLSLFTDPAEALNADVEGVWSARRAVNDAVLQLVVGRRPGHPAEEFTAILHQNCGRREEMAKRK